MTFCGLTWYIKNKDLKNEIIEDLEELLEEIQAEKVSKWFVKITKSSNKNSFHSHLKDKEQEMFCIRDNHIENSTLVFVSENNNNVWGFDGDFSHLSKTLNLKEENETEISIKGDTYEFSDFLLSFGKIKKGKNFLRDKIIKLEFKAVNKFAHDLSNYENICNDLFSSISEEIYEQLEVKKSIGEILGWVKDIPERFKAMGNEKLNFSNKYSGLILLKTFNLIEFSEINQ